MSSNQIPKLQQLILQALSFNNIWLNRLLWVTFASKTAPEYDVTITSPRPGFLLIYLETRRGDHLLEMQINTLTQPWDLIGTAIIRLPVDSLDSFDDLADELQKNGFSKPTVIRCALYPFLQFMSRLIVFWILKIVSSPGL